jgi:uncharacterized protein YkwD
MLLDYLLLILGTSLQIYAVGNLTRPPAQPIYQSPSLPAIAPQTVIPSTTPKQSAIDPQLIHDLINNYRRDRGLNALVWDAQIAAIAQKHSQDMAVSQKLDHDSPTLFRDRVAVLGNVTKRENIAEGYATERAVVDGWINSSTHQINMIATDVTRSGVGVYRDTKGRYWYTHVFASN